MTRARPTPAPVAPPPSVDVRGWPAAADSGLFFGASQRPLYAKRRRRAGVRASWRVPDKPAEWSRARRRSRPENGEPPGSVDRSRDTRNADDHPGHGRCGPSFDSDNEGRKQRRSSRETAFSLTLADHPYPFTDDEGHFWLEQNP